MKKKEQEEACKLRKSGVSIRSIAKTLGISQGSASVWTRHIKLTKEQERKLKTDKVRLASARNGHARLRERERTEYRLVGRKSAIYGSNLHRMGCMLYWGEGRKSTNVCSFSNTDQAMISLFYRFLKEEFDLGKYRDHLGFEIHIHDPSLVDEAKAYWCDVLKEETAIRIVLVNRDKYLKKPKVSSTNKHPMGCFHIRVSSTELQQKLLGAIEGYVGQDLFSLESDAKRRLQA